MRQAVDAEILAAQGCRGGEPGAGSMQHQGQRPGYAVHGQRASNAGCLAGTGEAHGGIAAGGEHVWRQGLALAARVSHMQARHLDRDVNATGRGMGAAEVGDACELSERTVHRHQAEAEDRVADLAVCRGYGQALGQGRLGHHEASQGDYAHRCAARGLCIVQRTP